MLRKLERVAKRVGGRRAVGDGREVEDGELGEVGHGYRVCQACSSSSQIASAAWARYSSRRGDAGPAAPLRRHRAELTRASSVWEDRVRDAHASASRSARSWRLRCLRRPPPRRRKPKAKVTVLGWFRLWPTARRVWQVRVKSDANKCQKERDVELYRRQGEDNVCSAAALRRSRGTASGSGRFVRSSPPSGDYFAFAPPTDKCKRAESKIFTYPDDNSTPAIAPARQARRPVCDP